MRRARGAAWATLAVAAAPGDTLWHVRWNEIGSVL